IVQQHGFDSISPLPQLASLIREPGSRLFDDVKFHSNINDFTYLRYPFSVHDIELHHLKRRCNLVFHHFHLSTVTQNIIGALFDLPDSSDIQSDRGVKLQGITPGSRFRVTKHDADLLPKLVDENTCTACLVDGSCQFSECL